MYSRKSLDWTKQIIDEQFSAIFVLNWCVAAACFFHWNRWNDSLWCQKYLVKFVRLTFLPTDHNCLLCFYCPEISMEHLEMTELKKKRDQYFILFRDFYIILFIIVHNPTLWCYLTIFNIYLPFFVSKNLGRNWFSGDLLLLQFPAAHLQQTKHRSNYACLQTAAEGWLAPGRQQLDQQSSGYQQKSSSKGSSALPPELLHQIISRRAPDLSRAITALCCQHGINNMKGRQR